MAARKKKPARKKPGPKPGTGGRPTKYRPGMCKRVLELMKAGKSQAQVCADLGIHTDTLYEWIKKHPDFSIALKNGTTLSEAEWSKIGHDLATGKTQGNVAAWIFNMKNRFGWRDQKSLEHSGPSGKRIKVHFTGDWGMLTGGDEDELEGDDA